MKDVRLNHLDEKKVTLREAFEEGLRVFKNKIKLSFDLYWNQSQQGKHSVHTNNNR